MLLSFLSKTVRAGLLAAAATMALAGVAQTASAATLPAEDYFPLNAGNRWVLRDAASGQSKEIRVDQRQGDLAYVVGLMGQDHWYGLTSAAPNSLYIWNDDASAWYVGARFGYITTPWRFDLSSGGCDLFDAVWARGSGSGQAGTTLTTAAGRFPASRELDLQLVPAPTVRCSSAAFVSRIFFAKGVGPVRMVVGGVTYDLETALVGGKAYPVASMPASITATLAAPKPVFINKPNTIRCIRAPCPSNEVTAKVPFTFTVTNGTASAVTFTFASGQQFDIELLDGAGRVVKAWSDGRAFTMSVTSRTLAAGASMTFTADLELKDRNAMQLDGTYTARARLTTATWAQPAYNITATNQVVCDIQP